jgi:hypothetical protein
MKHNTGKITPKIESNVFCAVVGTSANCLRQKRGCGAPGGSQSMDDIGTFRMLFTNPADKYVNKTFCPPGLLTAQDISALG